MFTIYNYYRQYTDNKEISDYKSFYRKFSNEREFGGEFHNFDHLVKHRFMDVIGIIWNAILRKKPISILDVGCGNGSNLPLSRVFPSIEYNGLDYAEAALGRAKIDYPNVKFHVGDAFDTKFEAESFDFVILSNVLILYEKQSDQRALLAEMSRVLSKNGVFALVVYNEAPLIKLSILLSRLIGYLKGENLPQDFDGVFFKSSEIHARTKEVGLEVVQSFYTGQKYGILESARYLNMSKYRRVFGKSETEANFEQSQSVLKDLQNQAGRLKWVTALFYGVSAIFPRLFAHYAVYLTQKE